MAKHRVKKHRSTKKHHSQLKTVGGFKAMEHKKNGASANGRWSPDRTTATGRSATTGRGTQRCGGADHSPD